MILFVQAMKTDRDGIDTPIERFTFYGIIISVFRNFGIYNFIKFGNLEKASFIELYQIFNFENLDFKFQINYHKNLLQIVVFQNFKFVHIKTI